MKGTEMVLKRPGCPSKAVGCALGGGWNCDRIRFGGGRDPGHAASRQAAPIELPPILLLARRRRIGNLRAGDEQFLEDVRIRRQHADHTCQRNQGGGRHKTQIRIQGPSPSIGVSAPQSGAKTTPLWRDYVRATGLVQWNLEPCL